MIATGCMYGTPLQSLDLSVNPTADDWPLPMGAHREYICYWDCITNTVGPNYLAYSKTTKVYRPVLQYCPFLIRSVVCIYMFEIHSTQIICLWCLRTIFWQKCLRSRTHRVSYCTFMPDTHLLHFAWVADDAKCIVVTPVCLSVCLSAAAYLHYTLLHGLGCNLGSGRGCPQLCTIGRICTRCSGCVAMAT